MWEDAFLKDPENGDVLAFEISNTLILILTYQVLSDSWWVDWVLMSKLRDPQQSVHEFSTVLHWCFSCLAFINLHTWKLSTLSSDVSPLVTFLWKISTLFNWIFDDTWFLIKCLYNSLWNSRWSINSILKGTDFATTISYASWDWNMFHYEDSDMIKKMTYFFSS